MEVLLGSGVLSGKIIEGNIQEIPKLLTKSASKQRDGLVDRLADVERQVARLERQIKDALSKLASGHKADLIGEAMRRATAKKVDKIESDLKQTVTDLDDRLRRMEYGAI